MTAALSDWEAGGHDLGDGLLSTDWLVDDEAESVRVEVFGTDDALRTTRSRRPTGCDGRGYDWREHEPIVGRSQCRYEIEHEEPGGPADMCRRSAPGPGAHR